MPRHVPTHASRPARLRPLRRWPRRLLLAVNLVVGLSLAVAGLAYAYARYRLDSIRTEAAPALTHTGRNTADGLPVENVLLIGNQTRAGLTNPEQIAQFGNPTDLSGSLSDVIMILHLDPAKRVASILSIPRDLFVPMPAGSPVGPYEKIDAALNDGAHGPNNLIKAIHDDLGIPINHYVELDFNGFEKTVNALGGIRMDFPEPLFDAYSQLRIGRTGCQLLDGAQALALVRARHLQYDPPGVSESDPQAWPYDPESDLARIVRDHEFLRVLVTTAEHEGLSNPIRANDFLGAVINQITIDPGLKGQLVALATHYGGLVAGRLPETTLPVTTVADYSYGGAAIGDVDFPVQPADNHVIAAWDAGALPAPVAPRRVEVVNAAGTYQLAADTATALRRDGLAAVRETATSVQSSTSETLVRYHPGELGEGMAVFREFRGAVMLQADAAVARGAVVVDVGSTEAVSGAGRAATTGGAPASHASVPTPGGVAPSSAADALTPYDPRPCSS